MTTWRSIRFELWDRYPEGSWERPYLLLVTAGVLSVVVFIVCAAVTR